VNVDEPRSQGQAPKVDLLGPGLEVPPDLGDEVAGDGNVDPHPWAPGAVEDLGTTQDEVGAGANLGPVGKSEGAGRDGGRSLDEPAALHGHGSRLFLGGPRWTVSDALH
jgi:hypothetical protein